MPRPGLAGQTSQTPAVLVITDGKPNDLDHYEGRHGIEDSARAVREARMMGHAVPWHHRGPRREKAGFRAFWSGGFPDPASRPPVDGLPRSIASWSGG